MSALAMLVNAMAMGFQGDPPYYVPEGPGECPSKIYKIYVPATTTNVSTIYETNYYTATRPASTVTIVTVVDPVVPSQSTTEISSGDSQTTSSTGSTDDGSSSTSSSTSGNDETSSSSTLTSVTTATEESSTSATSSTDNGDSSSSTSSSSDEISTSTSSSTEDTSTSTSSSTEDTSTSTSSSTEDTSTSTSSSIEDTSTSTSSSSEDSSTSTSSSSEDSSTSTSSTTDDASISTSSSTEDISTSTSSSTTTAETTTTSSTPTTALPPYVVTTPTDFPQPIPAEDPDVTKESAFRFPVNGPFWRYESYPDGTLGVFPQGSSSTDYQTNENYFLFDFPSSNEFSISRGYTLIINANGTFKAFVNSRRPVSETLVSDDIYEVAGFWTTQTAAAARRRPAHLLKRQTQDIADTDCAIKDICNGNSVLQTFPKGLNLQTACDRIEANLRAELAKNEAYVGQNSGDKVFFDGAAADNALDKDWIRNQVCDEGIRLFRNRLCNSVSSASCP